MENQNNKFYLKVIGLLFLGVSVAYFIAFRSSIWVTLVLLMTGLPILIAGLDLENKITKIAINVISIFLISLFIITSYYFSFTVFFGCHSGGGWCGFGQAILFIIFGLPGALLGYETLIFYRVFSKQKFSKMMLIVHSSVFVASLLGIMLVFIARAA